MKSNAPSHPSPTVVGIGASAGGLAALKTFFDHVPADSALAFVIVVHLSPEHESHLAELLQPHVRFPVVQVNQTTALAPNHAYIIPPNANLNSVDTHLRLSKLEVARRDRAPIDHFFRTLAETHDGHAIGVILTGTGSDGTLGVKEIKAKGGFVIVQDPNDAEYDGMPQSAVASGFVDRVLPLEEIPDAILRFDRTEPRLVVPEAEDEDPAQGDRLFLQKVFAHVRARTDRDFGRYKHSTVLRRIARRMQLNYLEDTESYLERLRENPDEARALADDFLITVTSFFRDEDVFRKLEMEIIPRLFDSKGPGQALRVWSVGCATGEEAYSLAILLLEEAARRATPSPIQVFASDLHRPSLDKAREGFYPGDIEATMSAERLRRFFERENGGYRVQKEVRDLVVFAPHNLLGDPPFSRLDLIACRNLLIYLQRNVQRDVIELFHYALNAEGILLLGSAETIDDGDLFRTDDKKLCIYHKRNVPGPEPRLPVFPLTRNRMTTDAVLRAEGPGEPIAYGWLHQRMLERFAPPSLLVSPDNKIVHLSEHAGRYLVHPGGELTAHIFKLVREELRLELQTSLQAARERKVAWDSKPIPVRFNGHPRPVVMHVRPALEADQEGFLLVIFEEREPAGAPDRDDGDGLPRGEHLPRVLELETEVRSLQQRLQTVIEECETSQEEMKASNEEMQSTNEELRSTMEELETSKEELQSINEELQTVNQENRHKVEELAQLTSDLQNLLAATDIATLFLDRSLRIMRFTPKLGELFNVRQTDRGRPISDLTHRLGYGELRADAEIVLNRLVPIEREVKDENDRWYFARVLPYRSTEDRIEGVVITFIEVSTRKRAENALAESERRLRTLLEGIPQLVWRSLERGDWSWASPQWTNYTGLSEAQSVGQGWLDAIHPDDRQRTATAWKQARQKGVLDVEHRVRRASDGLYYWHRTRSVPIRTEQGRLLEWLGTSTDVEDLKRAEATVRETEERFRLLIDNVREYALVQTDPRGVVISWNSGAERLFGFSAQQAVDAQFSRLVAPDREATEILNQETAEAARGQRREQALWLTTKSGTRLWVRWVSEPVFDDSGELRGVANVLRDETERKRTDDQMLLLLGELNHRVKNTLMTVQSIASQTLRENSDPAEFVSRFEGRLHALARAHKLLTEANWEGTQIADIMREQLAVDEGADRIWYSGPAAKLSAQESVTLALVLHELGTNARKYGALSVPEGKLSVKWQVIASSPEAGLNRLEINWEEQHGPEVAAPTRAGFGTALIERSLRGLGGEAKLEFAPSGVRCQIQLPIQPEPVENRS